MNQEIISEAAQRLFFERGIKAVNVDDIAASLGISKKTIYNHFSSKDEIISFNVDIHLQEHKNSMMSIANQAKNAIEEMLMIYRANLKHHKQMQPIFINDLQKLFPLQWKKMENFFTEIIPTCTKQNIQRGQKEGLYRENINEDLIAFIHLKSIFNLIEFFSTQSKFSLVDLKRQHIFYHIHAIGTPKGIKYLDKLNFDE